MHGATKNRVNCGNGGCKKLSNEDVELLTKLEPRQRCNWRSNRAYKNDSIVHELRCEITSAIARLTAASEDQRVETSPTPTVTTTSPDGQTETNDLAIENLRVQIDISNSLRGIWETLHNRGVNFGHLGDQWEQELGHATIPPRVGPDTLHPRFYGTIPATSADAGTSNDPKTGSKRAAPNGDGKTVDGGKRPRTE
ncbi:uncharacterized protein FPRO_11559 [Fusarium proliferatum ET1]|uniref:Uncharacterized protein n=1 Tax=Fusarium proliferatum (strain ET1) TaxID=1227346 RepID=A0A1L7W106_FUSPR|nr:uncharacterized protein FPRO_11559 [Fusarium proliferatum ET1]CZR46112.1 uncharacterized protein FPRO_11559 [Fusarium proliferatum ET1]